MVETKDRKARLWIALLFVAWLFMAGMVAWTLKLMIDLGSLHLGHKERIERIEDRLGRA